MTIDLALHRQRKALWGRLTTILAPPAKRERFAEYFENTTMTKHLFDAKEAAELLLLHPETVRRFVREGLIKAVKIGRAVRIERAELERYWRAQGGGELFGEGDKDE